MKCNMFSVRLIALAAVVLTLAGCVAPSGTSGKSSRTVKATTTERAAQKANFERDRQAILAMAGNYRVSFDFTETVSFVDGYELKDRKLSGGNEIVRVIEDRGDFISLQHILVVGGERKFPVKHWRQDWYYEPDSVLVFVGGNAWKKRPIRSRKAKGKWSQIVYQVDDSPRYGALGKWSHKNGISEWTPPAEWRPLPRRDATTRDDYHAIKAVNRHAITPFGWVHEQDNSKLILTGRKPQILAREVGVNTYRTFDDFEIGIGENYWDVTKEFWAGVRAIWTRIEKENRSFGLTIQGEPEELYMPILSLASEVVDEMKTTPEAIAEADAIIQSYVTTNIGQLRDRLSADDD